jgi:6-phosphogluconolactonase (cycloisomerase 2 family)
LGLSPDEKLLAVANYTGGSLSLFEVSPSHQLKFIQTIQHFGKSVNPARQERPHVHSTVFSPDGKYLLAADLGTDKIYVYQIDRSLENPLSLFAEYPMTPGDGPRHLVFSSGGSRILVVQEMAAVLEVFEFQDGKMSSIARHSLVSDTFSGKVGAAEVRVFEDGKFAYVSNRGDANAILVFENGENGYVKIQEISSGGIMPRNFNLTRDGQFLIVANQASNNLVVFARNLETGLLTPTQWKLSIHKPSYLFQLPD